VTEQIREPHALPPLIRGLGYVNDTPQGSARGAIRIERVLSDDEWEQAEVAIRAMARIESDFAADFVGRNYSRVVQTFEYVQTAARLGRRFPSGDRRRTMVAPLYAALVNFLAANRLYLDHAETRVKRQYGKASEEASHFKRATAEAFDGLFGYAFMYKLRNYCVHCGLPPMSLSAQAQGAGGDLPTVRWALDRDDLLNSYHEWATVRPRLEDQESALDVIPLVKETMDGMADVMRAVAEIDLDHALAVTEPLMSMVSALPARDRANTHALITITTDGADRQIKPNVFSIDNLTLLERVRNGEAPRSSLFVQDAEPATSKVSAQAVRAQKNANPRGFQVLSAWIASDGPKPAFAEQVNAMMAEDRSATPLINGLVDSAILFASMNAILLDTSLEALINNTFGSYADSDDPTS
jgi:hypothetical protein